MKRYQTALYTEWYETETIGSGERRSVFYLYFVSNKDRTLWFSDHKLTI